MNFLIACLATANQAFLNSLLMFWSTGLLVTGVFFGWLHHKGIRPGMSEEEVEDALGHPTLMSRACRRAKWVYAPSGAQAPRVVIDFISGRVRQIRQR